MSSMVAAFGLAITVTRPSPDVDPVSTSGIWSSPASEPQPYGAEFNRVDPRRVMSIPVSATLQAIPPGSIVVAPEYEGGPLLTWLVGEKVDPNRPDEMRVYLKQMATP